METSPDPSDRLPQQMKDPWLLPFILPCVFEIAKGQSKDEFNSVTLPALKPLFVLTDPPQNMLSACDLLASLAYDVR
jgi:SCY1-like protein 2